MWNIGNSNIKDIKVEYLGEKVFQKDDIIENNLIFKKRNSQYLRLDLLVPTTVSMDLYKKIDDKRIKNVEDFLDFYIEIVIGSIIFVYNKTHPKSYLFKYKSGSFGISDNLYKKNIYKVTFEIYDKIECVYFDVDRYEFLNKQIK